MFLGGKIHVEFRKGLNVLFTRRALGLYLGIQDRIMRRHFAAWLELPPAEFRPMSLAFRDLNMETSLTVFCGRYIPADGAKQIAEQYWLISNAMELVNFPLALPGTKVYKAIQARKLAVKWFEHACAESKKRMAAGEAPDCLVDRWVRDMQNSRAYEAGEPLVLESADGTKPVLIRDFGDREMALVIMSFLFASQDAMVRGRAVRLVRDTRSLPISRSPPASLSPFSTWPTTRTSSPSCGPSSSRSAMAIWRRP